MHSIFTTSINGLSIEFYVVCFFSWYDFTLCDSKHTDCESVKCFIDSYAEMSANIYQLMCRNVPETWTFNNAVVITSYMARSAISCLFSISTVVFPLPFSVHNSVHLLCSNMAGSFMSKNSRNAKLTSYLNLEWMLDCLTTTCEFRGRYTSTFGVDGMRR